MNGFIFMLLFYDMSIFTNWVELLIKNITEIYIDLFHNGIF